jgi:acetyltransferase-like isoleucine patch superfamily enzyme
MTLISSPLHNNLDKGTPLGIPPKHTSKHFYRIGAKIFHAVTSLHVRKKITLLRSEYLYRVHGISGVADLISRSPADMIEPLLVQYGASVGQKFTCKSGLQIEASNYGLQKDFSNLSIGNNCLITRNVYLDLTDRIIIGDYVGLGPQVRIFSHSSLADKPLRYFYPSSYKPVVIGYGAWIAACVTILSGITIGKYAVVAAGSVVTRDVPSLAIVAGIPARKIGELPHEPPL